jgi:sodium transport system permease protein
MGVVAAVIAKETLDNARDRRALSTAMLMPLLGPLSLLLLFFTFSDVKQKQESPKLAVAGAAHAPQLVEHLRQSGVVISDAPADVDDAIRTSRIDAALIIPADFDTALRAGRPAPLELVSDESRSASAVTAGRVDATLRGYSRQIAYVRLIGRGVDPNLMQTLAVNARDVGSSQGRAALLLGVVPLFLLMGCFMGGTYVAIDVTAGERERGSIEALLLNPVKPWQLVLGKTAVTTAFGLVGILITAIGFVVVVRVVPFADIGLDLAVTPLMATKLVLLVLPVLLLASTLQVFVGILSNSFKTAQAAISAVMIAPMLPSSALMIFPQQPTTTLMLAPTVGHNILLMRVLRGEVIAAVDVALAAVGVFVVAAVLFVATVKLFGPRLVVGR